MKQSHLRGWAYLVLVGVTIAGIGFRALFSRRPLHIAAVSGQAVRARDVITRSFPTHNTTLRGSVLESCVQCKVSRLFVPRDDVRAVLVGLIGDERERISVAQYKLTDTEVAQALIAAKRRGITVELVVDAGGLDPRTSQVLKLQSAGVPIYVFPHPDLKLDSRFAIMHNKFFIFHASEMASTPVVWTGSFNVTRTASRHNRENVVVIQSRQLAADYAEEFERLKGESHRL
ncbi:MAG: phospholipase D-like domain-containing protein [Candidatus Dependentiae bacterium]|jgi:phosphatidylserine/phosphatidylglycerophosphate/cardiolipin synthase-like enzyme|nr:phospholipase D-like domain-containing protein [Candidatus Dependentiae bacterium]